MQAKPFVKNIIDLNAFDKLDVHLYREIKDSPHQPMNTDDTITTIKLFCKNNLYNNEKSNVEFNTKLQKISTKLAKYNLARIDIKNYGNTSNSIEILNISDFNSTITRPNWFKNDEGEGILIESQKNRLNLELKCNGDGDLKIFLRSSDVRKDGKQIPLYIKYTNFSINDKIIFHTDKVVWHNEPYIHQIEVKNKEHVKLSIEWTPF